MPDYNEEEQRRKVVAGFKGGPFFSNPNTAPKMTFADGVPAEVKAKLWMKNIPQSTPTDPWFGRRNK